MRARTPLSTTAPHNHASAQEQRSSAAGTCNCALLVPHDNDASPSPHRCTETTRPLCRSGTHQLASTTTFGADVTASPHLSSSRVFSQMGSSQRPGYFTRRDLVHVRRCQPHHKHARTPLRSSVQRHGASSHQHTLCYSSSATAQMGHLTRLPSRHLHDPCVTNRRHGCPSTFRTRHLHVRRRWRLDLTRWKASDTAFRSAAGGAPSDLP
jgi:hypothetical protein